MAHELLALVQYKFKTTFKCFSREYSALPIEKKEEGDGEDPVHNCRPVERYSYKQSKHLYLYFGIKNIKNVDWNCKM